MKRLIIGCLSLLLIAAAPIPKGFVNDFANIIPDDREGGIEKNLQDYERATSIEIAVVTTASLEGREIEDYSNDLFRSWGVGKRGADNGVLVVIAPNERKYRVEVGRGLEGDLTDADTSSIAQESLVSAFRAGDYAGGIDALTRALVNHLGAATPEQRTLFHKKMALAASQRAEKRRTEFYNFLGTLFVVVLSVVVVLLLIGSACILFKSLQRWRKNVQRRKILRDKLLRIQPELTRLLAERSAIDLPNLPAWMQDDKEVHSASFGTALEEAFRIRKETELLIQPDIEEAEKRKEDLDEQLEAAEKSLESLRTLPEQVQAYRHETEGVVTQACAAILTLVAQATSLEKKRYRVTDIVPTLDLNRLTQEKKSIQLLLDTRREGPQDASEVVYDKATRLLAKVRSLQTDLKAGIEKQSASARRIKALQKRIQGFPALLSEHRARLERLRSLAPRQRWAALVEGLPVFERTLEGIAPRTEAANRANGMEAQLFDEAAATLTAAETALGVIDASVSEAAALESEITKAKKDYPVKAGAVERAVSAAERLMTDSDVGSGAKNRLMEATRLLASLQSGSVLTDWIAMVGLLEQASAKANQAAQLAQGDIDTAERERRRRRDEEERRQRLAREESSSYSSSSFGSSGSSSGFSFGGGDSGGGGASGGW